MDDAKPPRGSRTRTAASWVDRLQRWIEALPWPWPMTYLGLWVVLAGTEIGIKWATGAYAVGEVFPFHVVAFGTAAYALAFIHFLDRAAESALERMRPALDLSDARVDAIRIELTTMPATGALVATLAGAGFGLLQRYVFVRPDIDMFRYADAGWPWAYEFVVMVLVSWAVVGVFVYHAIRQLRGIDKLYRRHAVINLFHAGPLYAFSRLSAQMSVGIVLFGYVWIAAYPSGVHRPLMTFVFSTFGVLLALAGFTFVWPIWGAHQRLVAERDARQREAYQAIETTVRALHDDVASMELGRIDGVSKALAALRQELALLETVSTWPWRAATLRGFLSAVLLPLVLWATQQFLARVWIGPGS